MSSDQLVRAHNVGKTYRVYAKPHDRLLQSVLRHRVQLYHEHIALQPLSFEVSKGETLAIIGRNGSGKSTLLQLVCGTVTPSSGTVSVNGRLAALLELGAGFQSEFTGRENARLNASLMGLERDELDTRLPEIEAFADIGEFMDRPVRTYSSGMYLRLAFAVASSVEPEVLVVDEALAVGDEAFQRKCFARIHDIKDRGGAILFVSHSGQAVVELADRAMLLDSGEVLLTGPPKTVVSAYQEMLYAPPGRALRAKSSEAVNIDGDEPGLDEELIPASTVSYQSRGALIRDPRMTTLTGESVNLLVRGREYVFCFEVEFTRAAAGVRCGNLIKTVAGFELGGLITHPPGAGIDRVTKGSVLHPRLQMRCALAPGVYFVNCGVVGQIEGTETFLHRITDAVMFRVLPDANLMVSSFVDFGGSEPPTCAIE